MVGDPTKERTVNKYRALLVLLVMLSTGVFGHCQNQLFHVTEIAISHDPAQCRKSSSSKKEVCQVPAYEAIGYTATSDYHIGCANLKESGQYTLICPRLQSGTNYSVDVQSTLGLMCFQPAAPMKSCYFILGEIEK